MIRSNTGFIKSQNSFYQEIRSYLIRTTNYDLQEQLKKIAAEIIQSDEEKDPYKKFIEQAKQTIPLYQINIYGIDPIERFNTMNAADKATRVNASF